jgi:hypothetical protein
MKPKRKPIKPEVRENAHLQRLISIADNLVAASVAAFFVGIAVPQTCGAADSQINWDTEIVLALLTVSIYSAGIFIQKGIKK